MSVHPMHGQSNCLNGFHRGQLPTVTGDCSCLVFYCSCLLALLKKIEAETKVYHSQFKLRLCCLMTPDPSKDILCFTILFYVFRR